MLIYIVLNSVTFYLLQLATPKCSGSFSDSLFDTLGLGLRLSLLL